MRTILLATLLVLTACKKEAAKPAEPGAAEKKADDKTAPAAAPAGDGPTVANAQQYEALGMDMTNKLLAIFAADGKDCDKLAADMTKFGEENRKTFEAIKNFEKANPDAEKAFDEKMKPREKEFEEKLSPAFDACQNHEGMKKAMQSLPLN
jgi:hypothetical protein